MGPIRRLLRLKRPVFAGRWRLQRIAADDRSVAAAAIVTTILAAWRLSAVMSDSTPAYPSRLANEVTIAALAPYSYSPAVRRQVRLPASAAAGPAPESATVPVRAPAPPSDEVQRAIQRLLATEGRRAEFEAALGRMASYAPLIRATLRDRGVPQELLYLAMIESSYKPGAVSPAGATGMWQFMRGTAALYDLEVSAYVDERRDPVSSTRAAVRHLDDLHRDFGSWHLALAAYNAGPPRVRRALRRHAAGRVGDERLYWQIRRHLPAETRAYVPLFLAAADIARRPSEYGLSPTPGPPLAFREVRYPGGVSLAQIARARGIPAEQVLALNPHLVRGMTPPGRPWPVRLPVAQMPTQIAESE